MLTGFLTHFSPTTLSDLTQHCCCFYHLVENKTIIMYIFYCLIKVTGVSVGKICSVILPPGQRLKSALSV